MRSGALSPHVPASQRKRARGRLAKRLVKRDASLLTKYGRKTQAAVVGKLGSLASRLALALAPPAVAPLAAAVGAAPGTINVASETEEDRACSSPSYTITKMHESIGIVKRLYNLNVSERVLPPMKVIKRVAYFAEQHGCWPDPLVVRLEDMRRESSDSPATLYRRLLYAVLTVSAGAELDPESPRKDEGASDLCTVGVKPQWCNGNHVIRLVELVEAKRDVLPVARLTRLCQTNHDNLYSNTSGGSTSVSLALRSAWSTADMCATMLGGTMQGDGLRPHDGGSSHNSGPRAKPRASPPRRALRLSLASAPAAKAAAPAAKPRGRAATRTRWARKARTDCPVWWEGTRGGSLARTTPVADAASTRARIHTR